MIGISSTYVLSPEIELLLCCTQPQITTAQKERVRQIGLQYLDWPYLIDLVHRHGLMPLFYWQLKATFADLAPTAALNQLRRDFIANVGSNIALTTELLRMLNLFEQQGIRVLSFKGPLLAQLAYGDLRFRQFLDLDLLIPESELVTTHHLLLDQGYQPHCHLTNAQIKTYRKMHYELLYWHETKDITIDLHWSIFPKNFSFSPPSELIWSKTEEITLENTKVQTLVPEVLVVFLCAHAAKHNWSELSFICEIAHLLQRHQELNWLLLESYLGKLGSKSMTLLTLSLVKEIYQIDFPTSICQQLQLEPAIAHLSAQVRKQLFFSKDKPSKAFLSDLLYCQTMGCWQDCLWYWIDVVATPTPIELATIPLPDVLFPLYYPMRIIRLVWEYLNKAILMCNRK